MKWKGTKYNIVLEKLELTNSWAEKSKSIKDEIITWMWENDETTLVEEGEDILDGLETMVREEDSGVTEEILLDATEMVTAIIVARGLINRRVAPLFHQDGRKTTERISRIGRAEGMRRMREEMEKVKNQRLKHDY